MLPTPISASETVANIPDLVFEIIKTSKVSDLLHLRATSKLFKETFDFYHEILFYHLVGNPLTSRYIVPINNDHIISKVKAVKIAQDTLLDAAGLDLRLSMVDAAAYDTARSLIILFEEIRSRAHVVAGMTIEELNYPVLNGTLLENAEKVKVWFASNQAVLDLFNFIDLSNQNLKMVPKEIGLFRNLEEIILSHNEIIKFPEELLSFTRLKSVLLFHNKLRSLPLELSLMPNLEELDVSYNCLECFPESITSSPKLKSLSAGHNRITHLPERICDMRHLQDLYLPGNLITELPVQMGTMHELLRLDLSYNRLVLIPDDFCEMASIEVLNLSRNLLTGLPDNFGHFNFIRRINLSFNLLTELPLSVWEKTRFLDGFKIHSNPINLEATPEEFREFIDDPHQASIEPAKLNFGSID